MKKWLLIVFVAMLFLACRHNFDDLHYTITNNTGRQITVLFNSESISIPDGVTVSRIVNSGQGIQVPRITYPVLHPDNVQIERTGSTTWGFNYTFFIAAPIFLCVDTRHCIREPLNK